MSLNVNIEQTRKLLRSLKPDELDEQASNYTALAGVARRQQGADAARQQREETNRLHRELDDNQQQIESLEQQLEQNRSRQQEVKHELAKLQSENHERREQPHQPQPATFSRRPRDQSEPDLGGRGDQRA